jgi:UDP-N-acetyl-2-amino-2-deoxyglucuronate dehydrogenase
MNVIKTPIKIGVVGCGRIASRHFDAISKYDSLDLVAVCDIDPIALHEAVENTGSIGYDSYSSLLKNKEIEVIILCTPSGLHAQQTLDAAHKGKHIVTEKPMATSWEDGLSMVRGCNIAGVKLFVVKQNRYNKTLQYLKRAIDENRFGRIYMVNINVFWTRPQEYYDSAEWRGTWKLDGGAFMNQASHYVDLLSWLIGPIVDIHSMTDTLARNIQVEDTGVINIRWKSGILGSMNVTMLTYPKNLEGSITIIGEKGTVRVGGVAVNEIQHWEFEDKCNYDQNISKINYQTDSVYGFGHTRYYGNIIDVLRGKSEPDTDGDEGLKTLEILTAIYMSARNGKVVSLPLERE